MDQHTNNFDFTHRLADVLVIHTPGPAHHNHLGHARSLSLYTQLRLSSDKPRRTWPAQARTPPGSPSRITHPRPLKPQLHRHLQLQLPLQQHLHLQHRKRNLQRSLLLLLRLLDRLPRNNSNNLNLPPLPLRGVRRVLLPRPLRRPRTPRGVLRQEQ